MEELGNTKGRCFLSHLRSPEPPVPSASACSLAVQLCSDLPMSQWNSLPQAQQLVWRRRPATGPSARIKDSQVQSKSKGGRMGSGLGLRTPGPVPASATGSWSLPRSWPHIPTLWVSEGKSGGGAGISVRSRCRGLARSGDSGTEGLFICQAKEERPRTDPRLVLFGCSHLAGTGKVPVARGCGGVAVLGTPRTVPVSV